HTEVVGQAHDRAYDLETFPVVGHGADERAVDLQHVQRQRMKVTQRRIARTEVVDAHADADFLQLPQHRGYAIHVADHRAFGDFQAQAVRIDADLLDNGANLRGKIGLRELARRDVHA